MISINSFTKPIFFEPKEIFDKKRGPFVPLLERIREQLIQIGVEVELVQLTGSQMTDVVLEKEKPHIDTDFLFVIKKPQNPYLVQEVVQKAMGQEHPSKVHDNFVHFSVQMDGHIVDLSVCWDLPCHCIASANSFRADPTSPLPEIYCVDGYDLPYSIELLKRGFFYVIPGKPANILNGLRGYLHLITMGLAPRDYTIEKEFIQRWLEDHPTVQARAKFLGDLDGYFKKHYRNDSDVRFCFVANMRTVFAANEVDFTDDYCRHFPDLEKISMRVFWELASSRIDCNAGEYAARYRVNLPRAGSMLLEVPWEETLEELCSGEDPLFAELVYSRLTSFPKTNHPIGKILTLLAKDAPDLIVELVKLDDISKYASLSKPFDFGSTPIQLVLNAAASGRTVGARRAALQLPPLPYSPAELKELFELLSDWTLVAEKASHLLTAYLAITKPSEEVFSKVEKLPLRDLPDSWVPFIAQHPELYPRALEVPSFAQYRAELLEGYVRHLATQSATLELLSTLEKLPATTMLEGWSDSWIGFIDKHPSYQKRFLRVFHFSGAFKQRVSQEYIRNLGKKEPSEKLLHELSDYPACEFSITWPKSWTYFLEANPHLYEKFASAQIFGRQFRVQTSEVFLKAIASNLKLYVESLLVFFPLSPDFSSQCARRVLEKNTSQSLEPISQQCWTLLQLCATHTERAVTVSGELRLGALMMAIRKPEEFVQVAISILNTQGMSPTGKADLLLEVLSFVRFFRPKFTMNISGAIQLIYTILKDDSLIEKRKKLVDALLPVTTFGPLPKLNLQEPFEACLVSLGQDLNEEAFIHWLVLQRTTEPRAALALERLTREKTKISTADAIEMARSAATRCSQAVMEIAMEGGIEVGPVLEYLNAKKALDNIAVFTKFAIGQKDSRIALKIAAQIFKLSSVNILPVIERTLVNSTTEDYKPLFDAGMSPDLIWSTAEQVFTKQNYAFQIALGRLCAARSETTKKIIEKYFLGVALVNPSVTVLETEFISDGDALALSIPLLHEHEDFRNLGFLRVKRNADAIANLDFLAEFAYQSQNQKMREEFRIEFFKNIELIVKYPPREFFTKIFACLQYLHPMISAEEWEIIRRTGLRILIVEPTPENFTFMGALLTQFDSRGLLNEHSLLLFSDAFAYLIGNNRHQPNITFPIWRQLVLQAAKMIKTAQIQAKVMVILGCYLDLHRDEFTKDAELQRAYFQAIAPILSSTEFIEKLTANLSRDPTKLVEWFVQLDRYEWKLSELHDLLRALVEVVSKQKVPIHEIAVAHYIIAFELITHFFKTKEKSDEKQIHQLLDYFHHCSLTVYAQYGAALQALPDLIVDEPRLSAYVKRTVTAKYLLSKKVIATPNSEFPQMAPLKYVMSKIGVIHANILRSIHFGVEAPTMGIQLFSIFKANKVFSGKKMDTLVMLVIPLLEVLSREEWPKPLLLMEQINSMMAEGEFRELSKNEKWSLLINLVNEMTSGTGKKPPIYAVVAFSFLTAAYNIPEWEMPPTDPLAQLALLMVFEDLVDGGQIPRALDCLRVLSPSLNEYYSGSPKVSYIASKEPQGEISCFSAPMSYFMKKRSEIILRGLIERTIRGAKAIPSQRERALEVENWINRAKKSAKTNARSIGTALTSGVVTIK